MPGTTGSSGLNNLLESSQQVQTTLPSWYDAAQQNIINRAGQALQAAPQFQQTVGQQAVSNLQGPTSPFAQAQSALNTIASGAANPWIVDQATGQVTPNVSTPLGGLFSAQQQQLNQILPSITAPAQAAGIGTGQFGSLRSQTAIDKARADAFSNLMAQQMTAALQNQQAGVGAGTGLTDVGARGTTAGLTAGTAQMNAPFQGALNYANLVNALNVPGTVTQQTQESPLQMMGTLGTIPSGAANLLSSVFGSKDTQGTLANAVSQIPGLKSLFSGPTPGLGQMIDSAGNIVPDPTYGAGTAYSNMTPDEISNMMEYGI